MKTKLRSIRNLSGLLALVTLLLIPGLGWGQILVEDFDYTTGSLLTANGWNVTGTTATPNVAVTAASISFPGYMSSGIGNEVSLASAGQDVNRAFTAQTSGTIYVSCLVNITSVSTTGDYFFHLGANSIGTTFHGRVFVRRDASSNLSFGISRAGAIGTAVFTPYGYALGTTYLLVLKYTIVAGTTNDISAIYINPALNAAEPSTGWTVSTDTPADLANIGSVALRQGAAANAPALKLDGIRVSTSWSDIVGAATPLIDLNNTGFAQVTADATPNPGVTKVVLSKFKADVTNTNAVLNTLAFKTAGTYAITDLSKFELYYSSTSTMPGTSLASTTTIPVTGSTVTFSSLATTINAGNSGYFWITCDLDLGATPANTIGVLGTAGSGLVLTFASGTPTGTIADPALQTITASAASPQTITFDPLTDQTYGDAPFALGATASSGLTVSYMSSNTDVATISGNTVTIVGAGTTDITASQAGNASYLPAPDVTQELLVNPKELTVTGAVASDKPYDGNVTAVITGATLVGVINPDVVTVSGGGTFADPNVGIDIDVTAALTLGGADEGNYTLTQPVGLAADITQATQTITFNALANRVEGSAPFNLTATASSGLAVSYESSDLDVATISGNTVTIVGIGITTITASQAGNGNYLAAVDVSRTLTVTPLPIAAWDFNGFGGSSLPTFAATTFNSNLVSTSGANLITRGATAAWSNAANSFRTTGFKNEGIDVANTDYFEITLQPSPGKVLSLSTMDANLNGTGTFCATPGVTSQFAYSLDGTNFTLIGSPTVTIGGPVSLPQIDLTGVSALQNVSEGTTVTLRYYASGQTTTGGWGFYSVPAGNNGLAIGGNFYNASSTFTGTGNWSSAINWSDGLPGAITDVIIEGDITIDDLVECNNFTIANTGKVTLPSGKGLIVNGDFLIVSDITGTGSFIGLNEDLAVSGSTTVERYTTGGWSDWNTGWHQISSPVSAQAIAAFETTGAGNDYDFYGWDEITNNWMNYKDAGFSTWNSGTNFNPGQGYLISYEQTQAGKAFTGTLNTAAITMNDLSNTGSFFYTGWHLLGNPFPSALKWNDGNWALSNVAGTAKIWHEANKSYSDIAANGIIPTAQGFMVQVSSNTNSITIPAVSKVHDATAWYKSSEAIQRIFLVATESEGNSAQESQIMINPLATEGFDFDYDSRFLSGYAPQFYSQAGVEMLSTNVLSSLPVGSPIPFGFVKNNASEFRIELKESLDGTVVFLTDKKTNTVTNLTESIVYNFTAAEGDDANRFALNFGSVGIDDVNSSSDVSVYSNSGNIYVSLQQNTKAVVRVYSLTGQLVLQGNTNGRSLTTLNAGALPNGIYIVSVVNGEQSISRKVVVRK